MASSASKLIPSDPDKVTVIRNVTPQIKTLSAPFLRFGRIKIGGRGTIVQLASGNLAVFSPTALTDNIKQQVSEFGNGQVKYITALDREHHIFVSPWHEAFPDALVLAPDSLPESRKKQGYPSIPDNLWRLFTKAEPSGPKISEEFAAEFEVEYVAAHPNHELAVLHKPTRTLIEADLMFSLPSTEQFSKSGVSATSGFLTGLMTKINTTQGSAIWQKRFLWYALSSGDRPNFNKSVQKVASWDFDRIIPCHGDVIETGGKGVFEKVFGWHLEGIDKKK